MVFLIELYACHAACSRHRYAQGMDMGPHYLFVINPFSGAGTGRKIAVLLEELLPELAGEGWGTGEIVLTDKVDSAALTEKLSRTDVAVAVGGDGTVNRLVPHLLECERPPALGLIPLGTSNDLARALGISVKVDYASEAILRNALFGFANAGRQKLDVFCANDRLLFCNYLGIGFDAVIVQDFDTLRNSRWGRILPAGRLRNNLLYFLMGLKNVRFCLEPPIAIEWSNGNESGLTRIDSRCRAIIITSLPIYAGGCRIAPDARKDDGVFEITIIHSVYEFIRLILTRFLPFLSPPRQIERYVARKAEISLSCPVPAQIDGEKRSVTDAESSRVTVAFHSSLEVLAPSLPL